MLARGVTPGTRVIWDATTEQFGPHVVGKALDDRVPLAVITEVLRRVPPAERAWELTLACTVQEEIGLIGAFAAGGARAVRRGDRGRDRPGRRHPGVDERAMPLHLGAGPVLVHKDALVHYDHALTARLEQTAADAGHPDPARRLRLVRQRRRALMKADIPAAMVAFPARYTHSPFETGHLGDIEALVNWLCVFVTAGKYKAAV